MNAFAYLRVSGLGQVDGDGFERQRESINRHAANAGFTIASEFRELGVSGKTGEDERPAFQSMIADLLTTGTQIILIESLDRLARQYDVQQQLATYIASKGLTLISANTGEDITAALMGDPMRRALVQIQGIFAELDKNMLVAKLSKARRRVASKVGRCEGRKPYGEKPGEASILEQMMRQRAKGYNIVSIAVTLNHEGRLTRSGKPWHPSSVAKILARQTIPAQFQPQITENRINAVQM